MGLVIAGPDVELLPNLGLGDVVDGSPPRPSLKRKCGEDYSDFPPSFFPDLEQGSYGATA